jgi:hypothetical protein
MVTLCHHGKVRATIFYFSRLTHISARATLPPMTSHDVELAVIKPMVATLPAPLHVRGKPAATEMLLNVYRHALAGFERETLEKAWQKVAQEQGFWTWPLPETLVKAAEHFHILANPFDQRESDLWVERTQRFTDMAVKRFMRTSIHAARARDGGYEASLKEYVTEMAWTQAQIIEGREGIGYSANVLFGRQPDHEEMAEFFERARAQAKTGHIRLTVPMVKIAEWRGAVQADGRER